MASDKKDSGTVWHSAQAAEDNFANSEEVPACLVLMLGEQNQIGRLWNIKAESIMIGRSSACDICLEDRSVSARHAQIFPIDHEDLIIDLGSTNHTIVNGNELETHSPYTLANNDIIRLGGVVLKYLAQGNMESISVAQSFDRSYTDALTRVFNRGALALQGMEFFKRALVKNQSFALVALDIDHFKQVNDRHGHAAGDYVLVEFAKLVKQQFHSKDDFFARSGGEEFALMLAQRQSTQVLSQLETLRRKVESHPFVFNDVAIPITVSMGLAMSSPPDQQWQDVMERADQALYQSKQSGRNKISVSKMSAPK